MAADKLESLATRLTSIKVLIGVAALLTGGGAGSVVYLSRYALAADLKSHTDDESSHFEKSDARISGIEIRQAVHDALLRDIRDELRLSRMWREQDAARHSK